MCVCVCSSFDVVYDACSLIHMWARWPSVHDGLAAAMAQARGWGLAGWRADSKNRTVKRRERFDPHGKFLNEAAVWD